MAGRVIYPSPSQSGHRHGIPWSNGGLLALRSLHQLLASRRL
jgi:hypothetical protein